MKRMKADMLQCDSNMQKWQLAASVCNELNALCLLPRTARLRLQVVKMYICPPTEYARIFALRILEPHHATDNEYKTLKKKNDNLFARINT